MSKLTPITDRVMDLVSQAGTSLSHVGPSATKLLQTGAAMGAMKTGGRVAIKLVRRNPVVAIAAALGVGVLAYAARRKRKQDEANAPIEGRSRRIEAKRVNGTGKTRKSTASAKRAPRARKTTSTAPSAEA
ncbi:hypothetical protein DT603_11705 [Pseudoxanthomonas gei]|uniref:DUF3618 domain-containing protein n=1 Tax=Pseudoxanthomonas gei TaxID=1383030 RepID=A0ABX0AD76_9GAMM|nr:hypothetical protein [Pseudoxanthomonas gei]NDK39507.1 hypothetical protein [Pseudoxanthomonas gei]